MNKLGFTRYALSFLACICASLGTDITTFKDAKCHTSFEHLDTVNGYPDGVCTLLNLGENLEAFQVQKLDPECAVTLYGPNDSSGESCSSPLKIVAEFATCYNSSWVYYSIDNCKLPSKSKTSVKVLNATPTLSLLSTSTMGSSPSTTLGLSSASTSSTTAASTSTIAASVSKSPTSTPAPAKSSTSTAAIIGAIVGTIAVCAILIGFLLLWLHHRKHPGPEKPAKSSRASTPPSYELSQERAFFEAGRGSVVPPPRQMWAHEAACEMGRNSYAQAVELPDRTSMAGSQKKDGSAMIQVHLAR